MTIVVGGSGGERSEGRSRVDQSVEGDRVKPRNVGTRVGTGSSEVTEASTGTELAGGMVS